MSLLYYILLSLPVTNPPQVLWYGWREVLLLLPTQPYNSQQGPLSSTEIECSEGESKGFCGESDSDRGCVVEWRELGWNSFVTMAGTFLLITCSLLSYSMVQPDPVSSRPVMSLTQLHTLPSHQLGSSPPQYSHIQHTLNSSSSLTIASWRIFLGVTTLLQVNILQWTSPWWKDLALHRALLFLRLQ